MAFQTVFKRCELKYLLTIQQKEIILRAMELYMALDKYGRSTIRNIYFDTEDYRLIRRSIEKPVVLCSSAEGNTSGAQENRDGRVVELVDSLDSGSSVHCGRAGSSPASPTSLFLN